MCSAQTRPARAADNVTSWKAQYAQFIDPVDGDAGGDQTDDALVRAGFQRFANACETQLPDEGKPADPYVFASHYGAFLRDMDTACYHFAKAKQSFHHAKRHRSATPATETASTAAAAAAAAATTTAANDNAHQK